MCLFSVISEIRSIVSLILIRYIGGGPNIEAYPKMPHFLKKKKAAETWILEQASNPYGFESPSLV
jgi:hypothetical protein